MFIHMTSAMSVAFVSEVAISNDPTANIMVKKDAPVLEAFTAGQLCSMIKSLDDGANVNAKTSKDVLIPQLFKLIDETIAESPDFMVEPPKGTSGTTRTRTTSNGPSTKDKCYEVFEAYDLRNKDESKLACDDAMKVMPDVDKRVIQSYMTYYRNDACGTGKNNGEIKITTGKTHTNWIASQNTPSVNDGKSEETQEQE